ncbi:MAG: hypothetical protein JSR96_08350 [Proteobacteria bacterium]|nr:hypothetical protein [Pseudomonadota bacterium]
MICEEPRMISTSEYLPALDTELIKPDQVSVRLDVKIGTGTIDFVLVDTTPWPPGSKGHAVMVDSAGNTCLVVEEGQDRIFTFDLSPEWQWYLDPSPDRDHCPVTFKTNSGTLYRVTDAKDQRLTLHAKARPNPPTGGASDTFNLYVFLVQAKGTPVPVRIDPIVSNPPIKP